ncbi:MAG: cation:proton antiporter, partial [Nannocystaceae bacterium]
LKRLRRSSRAVRQLVLRGALITAVVATVLARFAMGWSWGLATLFGCLVIVTGPTVIGPLMRRLQVEPNTAAVLEGEGVLIDPLGAVVAVVALEFVLSPTVQTGFAGLWELTAGLGFGSLAGVVFGAVMAQVLRREHVIPEGMTNIFTLSAVIALFQGANALVHESGLAAVTVAGIVVRRMHTPVQEELIEFKEQLTMLLIGMLFVLLAADVRLADVRGLGWGGIWVVLGMMLLVRPLNVFLGTWGGGLRLRQKLFLSWIGPRGIVSAAVASLVAVKMAEDGLEGGPDLRALVFLVIAATVITAGLTGGMVARGLKLRRPAASGWLIFGAHPFGRSLAGLLASRGEDVTVLDRNAHDCRLAEEAGFRVVYGNALRANTLKRANIESRAGVIALTRNDEVNLLFINRCRKIFRRGHPTLLLARSGASEGVTEKIARDAGAEPLAGQGF